MRAVLAPRVLLAGPVALGVAMLVALVMPLWVPAGVGKVDNLVMPLVLFPLIWAVLFFHACLDASIRRVAILALALAVVHGAALGWHFLALPPSAEMRS